MWRTVLNLYIFQFVTVFLPNMSFVLYVNIWFGSWYQRIGEGGLQSKNMARPGKPGQAWMEGVGQVEVHASERPHSPLVKTRGSCWDKGQELSKDSGSKEHKGSSSRLGLVCVMWLMNNQRQEWGWHREQERPPNAGQPDNSGPSVLQTDISGTYYSMVLFKEKQECAYMPTFSL